MWSGTFERTNGAISPGPSFPYLLIPRLFQSGLVSLEPFAPRSSSFFRSFLPPSSLLGPCPTEVTWTHKTNQTGITKCILQLTSFQQTHRRDLVKNSTRFSSLNPSETSIRVKQHKRAVQTYPHHNKPRNLVPRKLADSKVPSIRESSPPSVVQPITRPIAEQSAPTRRRSANKDEMEPLEVSLVAFEEPDDR